MKKSITKYLVLGILTLFIIHTKGQSLISNGSGSYLDAYPIMPTTTGPEIGLPGYPTMNIGACGQAMWLAPCTVDYRNNVIGQYPPICTNHFYFPANPKVVAGFSKPIQTNDWWTPYIWDWQTPYETNTGIDTSYSGILCDQYYRNFIAAYGLKVHPQPLTITNYSWGLAIGGYGQGTTSPGGAVSERTVNYNSNSCLAISLGGTVIPNDPSVAGGGMTTISNQRTVDESHDITTKYKALREDYGTKVMDYGDWTVKVQWDFKAGNSLEMISGRGMPFVQMRRTGNDPVNISTWGPPPAVFATTANSLGFSIDNDGGGPQPIQHYGIFFPTGTIIDGNPTMNPPKYFNLTFDKYTYYKLGWNPNGKNYANILDSVSPIPSIRLILPAGAEYFSIALLPDNDPATLAEFTKRAFAYVTDSKVSSNYDMANAEVKNNFTLTTALVKDAPAGSINETVQALYMHQYKHSSAGDATKLYNSPSGKMRMHYGNSFDVDYMHIGLLPNIDWHGKYDSLFIYQMVENCRNQKSFFWSHNLYARQSQGTSAGHIIESYEAGKLMAKYADLLPIAESVGNTPAFQAILDSVESELNKWFNGARGQGFWKNKFFVYDKTWNTMVAYPSGYETQSFLNDHHFHYGYFVKAAAMVARYDPAWAAAYGPMVEMLIKDVDNWDRSDTRFPYMRFFDAYAGHSWASGHAGRYSGNDQESCSESINFATAVALWGANTHQNQVRDWGLFLATSEIKGMEYYWWNRDGDSRDPSYPYITSSLNWSDMSQYQLWFPGNPRHKHGINWLPVNGSHLYLGYDRKHMKAMWNEMEANEIAETGSSVTIWDKSWRDVLAQYRALWDPAWSATMLSQLLGESPKQEVCGVVYPMTSFDGTQPAFSSHWISSFKHLGVVDSVTSDWILTNVFRKDSCDTWYRHYTLYNPPTDAGRWVHFSDGTCWWLPAGKNPGGTMVTYELLGPDTIGKISASREKICLGESIDLILSKYKFCHKDTTLQYLISTDKKTWQPLTKRIITPSDSLKINYTPKFAGTYYFSAIVFNEYNDPNLNKCPLNDTTRAPLEIDSVVVVSPNTAMADSTRNYCEGDLIQLNANPDGMDAYSWSGMNGFNSNLQNPTRLNATLAMAGKYYVTITLGGCKSVDSTIVVIIPKPIIVASNTGSYCNGNTIDLDVKVTPAASAGATYSWSGVNGFASAIKNPSILNSDALTNSGIYTVTVTDGCSVTASTTVVINSLPVAVITGGLQVCDGASTTLTASGGTSYVWDNALGTSAVQTITPASTKTYSVTVTDLNGCKGNSSATITVVANPVAAINGQLTICAGSSTILTASGGTSYIWDNGLGTHPVTTVNPPTDKTYSVTVSDANSCTATASKTVVVNSLPVVVISGGLQVCNGASTTLTASGGTTYVWDNALGTSSVQTVTPASTKTYGVTVTDLNGCIGNSSATITVVANPIAAINGQLTICAGSSTILTASGGTSYIWDNGLGTNPVTTVNPPTDKTYSVTVTDVNSCTATASTTVSVNGLPVVVITGGLQVCDGASTTLTASGGTSYVWDNALGTSPVQTITPASTKTYGVTVTDLNGCKENSSATITVVANPVAAINGQLTICAGTPTTLTASGGVSYIWDNALGTHPVTTVNPPIDKTYSVTVTDANSCTATAITTVSVNVLPVVVITGGLQVCDGASTTLTASGGTSYVWDNALGTSPVQTMTPSSTKTYNVTVTDLNGCIGHSSATITVVANPVAAINGQLTICAGTSTTLTASGGVSYIWDNGLGTHPVTTVNPPTDQTYSITVTDANFCTATASSTVTVNPIPIGNAGINTTIVSGGSIVLTGTGGTSYVWDNGIGAGNGMSVHPIATTTYTVTVTDNNCSSTASITISVDAPLSITISNTNTTCVGNDGTASVAALGGSGNYEYVWNNNSTTSTIGNLASGVVSVTVTDLVMGLSASASTTILQPNGLNVILADMALSCKGDQTGSLTAITITGILPLTYKWNDLGGSTTATISALGAGTYSVTATDNNGNGCTVILSGTITEPLTSLGASFIFNDAKCFGASTGSILTTPVGGTGPTYTYGWNTGATTSDLTGIAAGNYHITITDENSCIFSTMVGITQPFALAIDTINHKNIDCYGGNTGAISFTSTGGIGNYTYTFNGNGGSAQSTYGNLIAGMYFVTVSDVNGCNAGMNFELTQPLAPLDLGTVNLINPKCFNDANGEIDFTAIGGTPQYSYELRSGIHDFLTIDGIFKGLGSNEDFYPIIKDGKNCVYNDLSPIRLINPLEIKVDTSAPHAAACFGLNADVILVASNGVGFSFTDGITTNSDGLFNYPAKGIPYQITVTDGIGCHVTTSITITEPKDFQLDSSSISASCGNPNGSITVKITNLQAGFHTAFSWDGMSAVDIDKDFSTLAGLKQGSYSVTVTTNNQCQKIASKWVDDPGSPKVSLIGMPVNPSCNKDDGKISVNIVDGLNPILTWKDRPDLGNSPNLTNLSAQEYVAEVTNGDGTCMYSFPVLLTKDPNPTVSVIAYPDVCNNGKGSAKAIVLGSTNLPFTFTWSGGVNNSGIGLDSIGNLAVNKQGYSVSVTDTKGCTAISKLFAIKGGTIIAKISASPATVLITDPMVNLANYSKGDEPIIYSWDFGDEITDKNNDGVHYYREPGIYMIRFSMTDAHGCLARDSAMVEVKDVMGVYFPNSFSPNSDGKNEVWVGKFNNINVNSLELRIFDRWGSQVFYTQDIYEGWNGRVNNTGDQMVQEGVYIFIASLKDIAGTSYEYNGSITLLH